jgi:hypothetical protein
VSFTLDRYGHLYPEADLALRDRLDQIHEAAGDDSSVSDESVSQSATMTAAGVDVLAPHRLG